MKAILSSPAIARNPLSFAKVAKQVINLIFSGDAIAHVKKNADICSVFHLKQATVSPTADSRHFLCSGNRHTTSSVPCGALMRPLPVSGGRQRGAELFRLPAENNQLIVSF